MTDRFWEWFGKAIAVTACLFVFTCACLFLVVLRDAYQASERPTFTVAPDTAKPVKGAK